VFVLKGVMLLAPGSTSHTERRAMWTCLWFRGSSARCAAGHFPRSHGDRGRRWCELRHQGLRIEAIREEIEYGGSRLRTTAALAGARIPITVDIGFGDAVESGVQDIDLPVLLDMPSPHLRAYPPETVIAEKVHVMVVLGRANSRMKDYFARRNRRSQPSFRMGSATLSPTTLASNNSGMHSRETCPLRPRRSNRWSGSFDRDWQRCST
jgi:hypothetical protein